MRLMSTYEEDMPTRDKIMEAIKNYIIENGFSPTIREICDKVGLKSTSTVAGHLDRLQQDGYITRVSTSPRTIRIIKDY
jgi:repressor LexA